MEDEKYLIIKALKNKETETYFNMKELRIAKSNIFSFKNRKEADIYWQHAKHDSEAHATLLNIYSLAISYGPVQSEELALAYYRRSAFFQHLKKYEEAINDTERALQITTSNFLKVRLYCTQAYCYAGLDRPEQKTVFEKVKFLYNKLDDYEEEKKEIKVLVDKLEKIVGYGDPEYARSTEKKKGIDKEEILSKKEAEGPFKSLAIKYNEKDGRHLVATRDIKAGEIISVSKPYTITSNTDIQPYLFCCHCTTVRWDSIPCNVCGWSFYCSEKCRDEAWEQYHDIECAVMPRIRHTAEHQHLRQLTVRTIIIAVREAGGIAELRKELQEFDKNLEKRHEGINEKFENDKFISIYSLISRRSTSLVPVHIKDAVKILIIIAKNTKLFGRTNKFGNISEFLADEDAIFIGSLILRLFGIFSVNYQEVWEKNDICQVRHENKKCFEERCCYRASMISPLFSLINHSCNPNAALQYTDANKLMLVALKPIKKDDKIYHNYSGCGLYSEEPMADRQCMCKTAYNFTCKCEACLNGWPLRGKLNQTKEKFLPNIPRSEKLVEGKLKKMKGLLTRIEKNKIQYNESTMKILTDAIEIATKNYAEPSFTISTLVYALSKCYRKLYLKRLRFPNDCDNRKIFHAS